jgi:hypothetical protein
MVRLLKRSVPLLAIPLALALSGASYASGSVTLFGPGASFTPNGIQLTSNSNQAFGGIDFAVPSGTTLGNLSTLAATFTVNSGDCGAGSPRYQLNVSTGSGTKNIFVYLGTAPNFNCGGAGATVSTGNLLDGSQRVDSTQVGGPFYGTLQDAINALGANTPVTGIQLVVDSGWAFPNTGQSFTFTSVTVNGMTLNLSSPTSKDQCKKGGWQTFVNPTFKNQGQCVSWVNHQEHGH